MMPKIILNYHHIRSANERKTKGVLSIEVGRFHQHIDLLEELITSHQLQSAHCKSSLPDVLVTFDDGYLSQFETIVSNSNNLLKSAVFFPIIGRINQKGYMSWEHLRQLVQSGHRIGAHGWNHLRWTCLPQQELRREAYDAKIKLEDELDCSIESVALPFGLYNTRVLDYLRTIGFSSIYSTRSMFNSESKGCGLIHRFNLNDHLSGVDIMERWMKMEKNSNRLAINSYAALQWNRMLSLSNLQLYL